MAADAREAIEIALGVPGEGWNAHVFPLTRFLLARTEAGLGVLSRAEVERLARLAITDLGTRRGDATAQSLPYRPLVLGRLLRLCEAEHEALDPERDPLAWETLEAVRVLVTRLKWARLQGEAVARKLPVLEDLVRLGEGAPAASAWGSNARLQESDLPIRQAE